MEPTINPEKETQTAVEETLPQPKKPGRKALQIFAVLLLIGLVGYGVYAWQNNRVAQLENQAKELNKETTETKVAADPYAGWKAYTMKYEKISLKYPSTYTLDAVSTPAEPHEGLDTDRISLVGEDKFNIVMQTGLWGVGGGCENCKVMYSEPITVLGAKYHLNYISNTANEAEINLIILATDTNNYMDFLKSKTIFNGDGSPSLMYFSLSYQPNGTDTNVTKSLTSLKTDKQIKQAKLVLQSLSY